MCGSDNEVMRGLLLIGMDLWFGSCIFDAKPAAGTVVLRVPDEDGYGEGLF